MKAVESNRIPLEKGKIKDLTFITVAYPWHVLSNTHKNAVETMVRLPRKCSDFSEMLKFLARQGLLSSGDGNESDANFM